VEGRAVFQNQTILCPQAGILFPFSAQYKYTVEIWYTQKKTMGAPFLNVLLWEPKNTLKRKFYPC